MATPAELSERRVHVGAMMARASILSGNSTGGRGPRKVERLTKTQIVLEGGIRLSLTTRRPVGDPSGPVWHPATDSEIADWQARKEKARHQREQNEAEYEARRADPTHQAAEHILGLGLYTSPELVEKFDADSIEKAAQLLGWSGISLITRT